MMRKKNNQSLYTNKNKNILFRFYLFKSIYSPSPLYIIQAIMAPSAAANLIK